MAWYNNWNDFKAAVSDAYDDVSSEISDGVEGARENTIAALKALNKEAIKYVHAPIRKGEREDAKLFFDEHVKQIASESKSNLEAVAGKMDSSIKGKLSKSIQKSMKSKASGYDKISE
ncbi:hypothetical protein [Streptococcus macacae]|uniref:Uncharacterized protein n=1 Tax=Streptococcus macacae NCTC 11558 TaxID=764298 RepID=G5JWV5_9STRE|nr:hypothetical protein [Streptococcus macacae]EHJ52211.1 hypothetical protein STRMA_1252 [Streptococcus macacae NCTC 11558]SUN79129.1 Uncharacterised protein [Streptococcus macacae NCTC 11558]